MKSVFDPYIEELKAGKTVQFRPAGHSMDPLIKAGQLVTVEPINRGGTFNGVDATSIVLVTVHISTFLHRVAGISNVGHIRWYRIEGCKGNLNGWVTEDKIHGVLTAVED